MTLGELLQHVPLLKTPPTILAANRVQAPLWQRYLPAFVAATIGSVGLGVYYAVRTGLVIWPHGEQAHIFGRKRFSDFGHLGSALAGVGLLTRQAKGEAAYQQQQQEVAQPVHLDVAVREWGGRDGLKTNALIKRANAIRRERGIERPHVNNKEFPKFSHQRHASEHHQYTHPRPKEYRLKYKNKPSSKLLSALIYLLSPHPPHSRSNGRGGCGWFGAEVGGGGGILDSFAAVAVARSCLVEGVVVRAVGFPTRCRGPVEWRWGESEEVRGKSWRTSEESTMRSPVVGETCERAVRFLWNQRATETCHLRPHPGTGLEMTGPSRGGWCQWWCGALSFEVEVWSGVDLFPAKGANLPVPWRCRSPVVVHYGEVYILGRPVWPVLGLFPAVLLRISDSVLVAVETRISGFCDRLTSPVWPPVSLSSVLSKVLLEIRGRLCGEDWVGFPTGWSRTVSDAFTGENKSR
ncbi:hypothetical protein KC363_g114 [Hortaea werneckii]|nr:hypothetical protein KC363_g114 [Hortaea werneckii]